MESKSFYKLASDFFSLLKSMYAFLIFMWYTYMSIVPKNSLAWNESMQLLLLIIQVLYS